MNLSEQRADIAKAPLPFLAVIKSQVGPLAPGSYAITTKDQRAVILKAFDEALNALTIPNAPQCGN